MPITIFQPNGPIITPGIAIHVGTNITWDPLLDWHWQFTIVGADGETPCLRAVGDASPTAFFLGQWAVTPLDINVQEGTTLQDGAFCRLLVQLMDENNVQVESLLSPQKVYDSTTGLPKVIEAQGTVQGGLTEEEKAQLAGTAETSAIALLTDALTLTEVTNGPTGAPLNVPLGVATFGVIVRLATTPEGLAPQTPDGQYWVKTLATVRVFRLNDLWFRVPIHTPTKIVPFAHEGLQVWVSSATLNQWILGIRVLVDWLPGVTGQVFLMHTP